jgi:hypothetical protein
MKYVVGPAATSKPASDSIKPTPPVETVDTAVRDVKISWLLKYVMSASVRFDFQVALSYSPLIHHRTFEIILCRSKGGDLIKLYGELAAAYPDHLPVYTTYLAALVATTGSARSLTDIIKAADVVVKHIDQTKLALHFGMRVDTRDVMAVTEHAAFDKEKAALVKALSDKVSHIASCCRLTFL